MNMGYINCPTCGEALKVNAQLPKFTCNYCGTEFQMNKNICFNQINNGQESFFAEPMESDSGYSDTSPDKSAHDIQKDGGQERRRLKSNNIKAKRV